MYLCRECGLVIDPASKDLCEECAWRIMLSRCAKDAATRQRWRAEKLGLTEHFTGKEWYMLLDRYHFRCVRCKKRWGGHTTICPDHVVPLSRGGTNTIDNIQPLCLSCNSSKSNHDWDSRPNFL